MLKSKKKMTLTARILMGLGLGLIVGILLNFTGYGDFIKDYIVSGLFYIGGQIFLSSLKLLVVPVVFISLVVGTSSLGDIRYIGRLGGKTLGLYLITTLLAISIALVIALFVSPGRGFELVSAAEFNAKDAPALTKVLIDIFPSNPIQAMADGNMLQIIVFSLLLGVAITSAGAAGKRIADFFSDLNEIVMRLVMIVMEIAPFGVFFLIAKVFAEQGFGAIVPLAKYFFTVVIVLFIHAIFVYSGLLKTLSGLSPVQFFKNFRNPIAFAFSTASSNATIPVTLEAVEKHCGVKNSVASFTIPLGATVNMDGTSIMQGVATIFVAQAYGLDLSLTQLGMVVVTATLASIGTAGVPGVGLVMLSMVFRQVGLPLEGIGLILGVDRLLDMLRTVVNITGDAAVTCIVAKSEKAFGRKSILC